MAENHRLGKKRGSGEVQPQTCPSGHGAGVPGSTPGDEGFIFGNLCNAVLKFLLDFSGHEGQKQPFLRWKPDGA